MLLFYLVSVCAGVLSACFTLVTSHTLAVLVCVYVCCYCVLAHKSSGHLVEDGGLDFGTPSKEEKISWFYALFFVVVVVLFCFSFFELSPVLSQCQIHQNG